MKYAIEWILAYSAGYAATTIVLIPECQKETPYPLAVLLNFPECPEKEILLVITNVTSILSRTQLHEMDSLIFAESCLVALYGKFP